MAIALPDASAPAAGTPAAVQADTLLDRLRQLLAAGADGMRRSRAQARLGGLDDRALKDIGIHRTEISSILHHGPADPSRRRR